MIVKRVSILLLLVFTITIPQANAFLGFAKKSISVVSAISKNTRSLPEGEIVRLSNLSDEMRGTDKVGKYLSTLQLPNDVLEDTFLRIAVHQNKLTREAAEDFFSRLNGVPGFRTTLRKIIGNSDSGTVGHLNELEISSAAFLKNFKIIEIGKTFNDGLKKGFTDIDILLEKRGNLFAIEAKNYASSTKIPMDKFRADMDTLTVFKNTNNNVITVFTITNKPDRLSDLKRLKQAADKRGVQLIFGTPQEQIEQINMLEKIL